MADETVPLKVLVFRGPSAERRTWMYYIPGPELFVNKKDAGVFPRIKNAKGEWKFKSTMPDAKGMGQFRSFTVATFEPKWKDQIVQRLSQVNIPKAEDITNYETQARQWHATQTQNQQAQMQAMQQQNPGQPPQMQPIAMPEVPGLQQFTMMMNDPALRSKAWVNEGISNLAMWTLPGPNNEQLPSPMNWEWKGLWRLSEEPFLPPELEKFDEYNRTLTVRADEDGQKLFYYRGQKWTEVPVEESPCKKCTEREKTLKEKSIKKMKEAARAKALAKKQRQAEPEEIYDMYDEAEVDRYGNPLPQQQIEQPTKFEDEGYISAEEDELPAPDLDEAPMQPQQRDARRGQAQPQRRQTSRAPARMDDDDEGYGGMQPRAASQRRDADDDGYGGVQPRAAAQRRDTGQRGAAVGQQPRRQNTMQRQVRMEDENDYENPPAPLQRRATTQNLASQSQAPRRQNTRPPPVQVEDYDDDSVYEGQPTPMHETAPPRRQNTAQRNQVTSQPSRQQVRPPPPQVDDYDSGYESDPAPPAPAPLKRAPTLQQPQRAATLRTAPQRTRTMDSRANPYQQNPGAFGRDAGDSDDDFQPRGIKKSMTDPRSTMSTSRGQNQAALQRQQSAPRLQNQGQSQGASQMGPRRQDTMGRSQGAAGGQGGMAREPQMGVRRQNTAPLRGAQAQRMKMGLGDVDGDEVADERPDLRMRQQMKRDVGVRQQGMMDQMGRGPGQRMR